MQRLRWAGALACFLALLSPLQASAHAVLLSSTPAAGQTLTALPASMVLTYDDDLRTDSSFQVLGAGGQTVLDGGPDASDAKSLSAPMPALANGSYDVHWTAISADDGFIARGSFSFQVALASAAPSAAAPGSTASSSPGSGSAAPATASPSPTAAAPAGTASDSSFDVLIPIAVVGVVIGVGLGWFLRRRGST